MNTNNTIPKLSDTVEALNNMSKTQLVLSEAILKQRSTDDKHAEALIILARAAETNAKANLNMSETMLKDKPLIDRLISLLEGIKK